MKSLRIWTNDSFLNHTSEDGETVGGEDTLCIVVGMFFPLSAPRKSSRFASYSSWSLPQTDSGVGKVRKYCLGVILFHHLLHFPLKTVYAVRNAKGETCKPVEVVSGFEGCVWFIHFL